MRPPSSELPDIAGYFDPEFTRRMAEGPLRLLNHTYFRAKIIGLENVPKRNPGDKPRIFYSNHSGMSFPWDAMVFATHYWEKNDFGASTALRPLVAPMLSATKVMNPFMIDNMWKRCGGVDATLVNFEALMEERAHDVLIYPEGVPGIGKGFDRRYEIQQFSTSFLRMAVKYKADIVPFYTINAEYTHPFSYRNDALNSLVQKLGIPFLPLSPLTALVPGFPFLFYFGMPARMTFVVDKPIRIWKDFEGRDPNKIKRNEFRTLRDHLAKDFQGKIHQYEQEHGKDPFDVPGLISAIKDRWQQLPFILPSGWPLLFRREFKNHINQTKSPNAYDWKEFLVSLLGNPEAWPFMIPFGWSFLLPHLASPPAVPSARRQANIQEAYFRYSGPERRKAKVPVSNERRTQPFEYSEHDS